MRRLQLPFLAIAGLAILNRLNVKVACLSFVHAPCWLSELVTLIKGFPAAFLACLDWDDCEDTRLTRVAA